MWVRLCVYVRGLCVCVFRGAVSSLSPPSSLGSGFGAHPRVGVPKAPATPAGPRALAGRWGQCPGVAGSSHLGGRGAGVGAGASWVLLRAWGSVGAGALGAVRPPPAWPSRWGGHPAGLPGAGPAGPHGWEWARPLSEPPFLSPWSGAWQCLPCPADAPWRLPGPTPLSLRSSARP